MMESNRSETEKNVLVESGEHNDTSIIVNEFNELKKLMVQIELKQTILLSPNHWKLILWTQPWDEDRVFEHIAESPVSSVQSGQKNDLNQCRRNLAANIFYNQREAYFHLSAILLEYKKPACQQALAKIDPDVNLELLQSLEELLKNIIKPALKAKEKEVSMASARETR